MARRPRRVFVIDDDHSVRRGLARLLAAAGWEGEAADACQADQGRRAPSRDRRGDEHLRIAHRAARAAGTPLSPSGDAKEFVSTWWIGAWLNFEPLDQGPNPGTMRSAIRVVVARRVGDGAGGGWGGEGPNKQMQGRGSWQNGVGE